MKKTRFLKIFAILLVFVMSLGIVACTGEGNGESETTLGESLESGSGDASENTSADTSDESEKNEFETSEETTDEFAVETKSEATEETIVETTAETEIDLPETNLQLGDDIEYADAFTVSKVFSSDMVLQRDECIRIWGWADESQNGKKVSATFMGYRADALIENGEWEIVFYQRFEANASLGNDLIVYGAEKQAETETESESETETETETEKPIEAAAAAEVGSRYIFEDILIGDVFMVIGQSNVQYSVGEYLAAEPDLKWTKDQIGEDSIIRFNYNSNTQSSGYPTKGTDEVCKDAINGYGWVKPNASNVSHFSAIGYFMAHQIVELTDNGIPVGISQFSASGRPLSVFMPNELAEKLGSDHFDESKGIYIDNLYAHVEARYMYNHYMNPFERMPIAGLVWYQGEAESNIALAPHFAARFTALMEYMRSTHNIVHKDFPVFFVEFPSVYRVKLPDGSYSAQYLDTGRIRAESCMIPQYLSNSYVAVCSDLWDDETNTNNVHPYCKYEQAERVSALVNAVIYGGTTLEKAAGPILDSYEISDDNKTMIIKFKNVGEGLTTSDGGTTVNGFGALQKNNTITERIKLTVEITGKDTITVTSTKPFSGVAYNYIAENFFGTDVNLCDSDGTPAHAFWIYIDPRAN